MVSDAYFLIDWVFPLSGLSETYPVPLSHYSRNNESVCTFSQIDHKDGLGKWHKGDGKSNLRGHLADLKEDSRYLERFIFRVIKEVRSMGFCDVKIKF